VNELDLEGDAEEPLISLTDADDDLGHSTEESPGTIAAFSLDAPIPYLFLSRKMKAPRTGVLEVDPTVMQIDVNTSLFKVHFLFTMLGLGQLFVTNRGKLVGVITRKRFIRYLKEQP